MEDKMNDTVDTGMFSWGKSKNSSKANTSIELPVAKDAEDYNMNHPKRGQAIIFNNVNFDSQLRLNVRSGSDVDRENLEVVLATLGFKVTVHEDLRYKEIKNVLEKAAEDDHKDEDCIFVAVLSHGELGKLYSSDHHYTPDILWSNFTADKCPSLAGKPKIFLMQACQGDRKDDGVDVRSVTETDSPESNHFKIPSMADFLLAYSTIPGFYSWRNTKQGTWYIQKLSQVLHEDAYEMDILSLLTRVARKVAFEFQSNVPKDAVWHEKKQIPCFTSMLTRNLTFNSKESS